MTEPKPVYPLATRGRRLGPLTAAERAAVARAQHLLYRTQP
jgi:hypothetical protein